MSVFYNLAVEEGVRGNLSTAINYMYAAIEREPENPLFYFELGNMYLADRHYSIAIKNYYQALSINSSYEAVYYNLGYIRTDLGEHEKAIEFFSQAINIKPNFN